MAKRKLAIVKQVTVKSSRDGRKRYKVTKFKTGHASCSCPHFVFRLNGTGQQCKHMKAAKIG